MPGVQISSRTVGVAQIITGSAAVLAMLYFLRLILIPFIIAFVLAVLVNALVQFIHNRWANAPGWAVSALAGLVVIVVASSGIFAMAQGAAQIVSEGPVLVVRLDAIAQDVGRALHVARPLHLSTVIGSCRSLPSWSA